jgi:predicted transcriptional regulator
VSMTSAGTLRVLYDLAKFPNAGPAPVFSHLHICGALLAIGDEGPMGRLELSRGLGIGEGTIRTIIRRLTKAGIITTGEDGCRLTRKGVTLYNRLRRKLSRVQPVDAHDLSLDRKSAAIVVKASGDLVKRGVEQRDAAIRAGATGACTLVYRNGAYLMPMGSSDSKLNPPGKLPRILDDLFAPTDNDVLIIASAPEKELAEYGAIAAALTLME